MGRNSAALTLCGQLSRKRESSMSSSHYDLITVGGGMAASALAKSMAESGAKVLVLEQETRFRDRIRGEYMMPWGVAEIAALGIHELLCRECAQKIPWIDLGMGGPPREFTTTTPQQQPGMGYSHPEMQEALLTAAECSGAEVRRGVTVQGVEPRHAGVRDRCERKEFGANFGAARGGRGRTQFANAKMGGVRTDKRA